MKSGRLKIACKQRKNSLRAGLRLPCFLLLNASQHFPQRIRPYSRTAEGCWTSAPYFSGLRRPHYVVLQRQNSARWTAHCDKKLLDDSISPCVHLGVPSTLVRTRQRCRACPSPALTRISRVRSLMRDGTPSAFVQSICYVHTSCTTKLWAPYGDESTLALLLRGVKLKADAV